MALVAPAAGSITCGHVTLVGRGIEVLEALAGRLGVGAQVEVRAVGDALELVQAPGEPELDVSSPARVVRQLLGVVLPQLEHVLGDAELPVPAVPLVAPVLEPPIALLRGNEVLHLHLLELSGPKDEVLGGDLVAERLADLRDAERGPLAGGGEHVLEVHEHALGGLGTQVGHAALVLDGPGVGLEHEVEGPGLGQILRAAVRADPVDLVGPPALVAVAAVDERVGERLEVAGRPPDRGWGEDRRVEADDVVAELHHRPPPGVLHVAQEVDAERPVVVGGAEAAVDLRGGEDEAAPLAEVDDLLHEIRGGGRSPRSGAEAEAAAVGRRLRGGVFGAHPGEDTGTPWATRSRAVTSLARSRPCTVSTARSPATSTSGPSSGASSGPGRHAAGTPAGVRSASARRSNRPLVGGETLLPGDRRAPGRDGVDVAIGGADVPPPVPVAVGVRGRPDAEVVPLAPVQLVVPAPVSRPGPVGDLLPAVPGGREHLLGDRVAAGLCVLVGMEARRARQGRARLDRQRVGAQVRGRRGPGQDLGEAAAPVVVVLACRAEDQVGVPAGEARVDDHLGRRPRLGAAVTAAEGAEHVRAPSTARRWRPG